MTSKQRLQMVQSAGLCVNCLKSGHKSSNCSSTKNCQTCNRRHNTLLHLETQQKGQSTKRTPLVAEIPSRGPTNSNEQPKAVKATSLAASHIERETTVLLSTVVLNVTDAYGQQITCRAILDNGSQVHLVSQNFAKRLGIHHYNHHLSIQGIGETQRQATKRINFEVSSRVTSFNARIEAQILPKIVSQQPCQHINIAEWNIPKNIKLADPQFNIPNDIDLLIGAGLFFSTLSVGQINLGPKMPILQNTLFGWIVGGEHLLDVKPDSLVCGMCTEEELLSSMEKFWDLEECSTSSRQMTTAELKCERFFSNNHRRSSDGRFVVKLPFREDSNALGRSYEIALQRLRSVEKRLSKDEVLRQEYTKFMQEYQRLGHMTEIPEQPMKGPHYFLPHHAVIKPDSTTTKVRVVFDASAKTSSNVSLNDLLEVGPTIQNDVFTQLIRFRFPRYAFTADIEKMYRQVWVDNDDRPYQLIIWRSNPEEPTKIFQLNTITYGTSCAQYLAVRCLQQLAEDNKVQYPLASHIINTNFYVDDVLAGADDVTSAIDKICQLRELLTTAGFNLRKWCSNDQRLLKNIPQREREVSLEITPSGCESVKTMGLIWTPREDSFSLRAEIASHKRVTKRNALAEISSIFDPLGFMAPVTITAKIFLQRLWKLKVDCDAALPQDLDTEWIKLRSQFHKLNLIKVPRHLFGHQKPLSSQIHIFADASEQAYGAVAYMRSISKEREIIIRLICAKSKVAPTKQTTLPRLELCAAKLAADLMKRIQTDTNVEKNCFHLWSDSMAVLGWINAESSNFHTFIANRIASIQRISSSHQWHHVSSQNNPADIISRGLTPVQLVNNIIWFYGPRFLHSTTDTWTNHSEQIPQCEIEKRAKCKIAMTINIPEHDVLSRINHGNSFRRLQRVLVYICRFLKPKNPGSHLLGKANLVARPGEMEEALRRIIKYVQRSEFNEHITYIKKNKVAHHNSCLAHLSPFIDDSGILRVGGRLEAADISFDSKHPMLLPHKHVFTKLLMTDIHKENMHAGVQTLLAITRQKFWVVNGKTLARNIIHNCVQWTRAKPRLAEQIMGHLPKDRVTAARPFLTTGVDFFGPIYVHFKTRGKRPQKAYVSVFCCFSTKAIHMEIVSDLTTEAFIGALKRFTGRRGRCQKIYCDNATNFIGSRNQLKEMSDIIHTEEAQTKILNMCSKSNIEFCFIPPRAPHFGG